MTENTLQDEIILKQNELIEKQDQEIKRLRKLVGHYKRLVEIQESQIIFLTSGAQILTNMGNIGQIETTKSRLGDNNASTTPSDFQ